MEQILDLIYPPTPFENRITDLEQRLKNSNDVNSSDNHMNNIKEMITYFKDKRQKSKKRYKNYETPNTILESIDKIIFIGATSKSVISSITGVVLTILPI